MNTEEIIEPPPTSCDAPPPPAPPPPPPPSAPPPPPAPILRPFKIPTNDDSKKRSSSVLSSPDIEPRATSLSPRDSLLKEISKRTFALKPVQIETKKKTTTNLLLNNQKVSDILDFVKTIQESASSEEENEDNDNESDWE